MLTLEVIKMGLRPSDIATEQSNLSSTCKTVMTLGTSTIIMMVRGYSTFNSLSLKIILAVWGST